MSYFGHVFSGKEAFITEPPEHLFENNKNHLFTKPRMVITQNGYDQLKDLPDTPPSKEKKGLTYLTQKTKYMQKKR